MKLIALFALSLTLSACQTDSFYVENASLSELQGSTGVAQALVVRGARPAALKDYFGLSGHRIVPGVGTVLAYRAFQEESFHWSTKRVRETHRSSAFTNF